MVARRGRHAGVFHWPDRHTLMLMASAGGCLLLILHGILESPCLRDRRTGTAQKAQNGRHRGCNAKRVQIALRFAMAQGVCWTHPARETARVSLQDTSQVRHQPARRPSRSALRQLAVKTVVHCGFTEADLDGDANGRYVSRCAAICTCTVCIDNQAQLCDRLGTKRPAHGRLLESMSLSCAHLGGSPGVHPGRLELEAAIASNPVGRYDWT